MFQISFSGPGIAEIKYSFLCPVPCNFYDDTSIAVNCSVNCPIRHRIIIEVNGEYIPRSDGSIITSDGNSFTRRVPADLRPLRHNYDALGKLYSVFPAVNRVPSQHIGRIRKHLCGRIRRNRLIGHEAAFGQLKPPAVDGHLDVLGICNAVGLAKRIFCVLIHLEAESEVQRMRSKFACGRVIWQEWMPRLYVNQAEFDREQNVRIIRIVRSQVAVVVVRHGAHVIDGHVKSVYDI